MWKRIKSWRSQCLKWNLFSVSISCHDRNSAFPVELVRFLTLRGWILLRNNHLGFYVHWLLPTSVVRALWCECCAEPLFFLIHIPYTDHHSRTSAALMQDWVLRLCPGPEDFRHFRLPQDSREPSSHWGIDCFVQAPRFCLIVAFSLCSSPARSAPRCHQSLPPDISAQNFPLSERQMFYFYPIPVTPSLPSPWGKGWCTVCLSAFFIHLFPSCGSGRGEQSITYRQLSSLLLRLIFELNSKMMVMMTMTMMMMMILPYGLH